MKYRCYTGPEVIEKTREVIHLFAGKKVDDFLRCLDPGFSWVADTEGIFLRGADKFAENIRMESRLPPVKITREEYSVAVHERRLWVVYGRFAVESPPQSATVHFTFAWVQRQEGLFLVHANASHARSAPVGKAAQAQMFLPKAASAGVPEEKCKFRDTEGSLHFLLPHEILYLKSCGPLCEVHTGGGAFQTRAALHRLELPGFFLIRRGCLVNTAYIRAIRRYQATLLDGAELPISRERYMELKRHLQKTQEPPFEAALGIEKNELTKEETDHGK